ncbi:MAG: DinB family protein, partial [Chloroflexi bacterium]|nr:DinB family protein [Chloroflexota bacterium]
MTASPGSAGAEATAGVLRRVHDSYRELVTGLDDAAVNYKPGADTNSIYQLMHHALDVERMWISMARDTPIPGRPEPWKFVGPAADLIPRLDEAEQDIQRFLESG